MTDNKYNAMASALIKEAVEMPGRLAECYSVFCNYSILNALALASQIRARAARGEQITLGPVASFKKWSEFGGKVKKGSKALWVNIPMVVKKKKEEEKEEDASFMFFRWKPCVFCFAQVEGINPPNLETRGSWDIKRAMEKLGIKQIPFSHIDGNTQGYATKEGVALNPVASHPVRTLVHECAHFLLHFGKESTPDNLKEVEAETVSYIVGACLGLDGAEESRGYIQHYLASAELPEKSAKRILSAANKIIKEGKYESGSQCSRD